jgi:hypothetical protein
MVILLLLLPNCNKVHGLKKAEAKGLKLILVQFTTMFIMILIVLAMSLMMFMPLSLFGHLILNLILVALSSRFTKIGKRK